MTVRRIFHIQPGTDGGTERFFVTLADAFAERGIEQAFAIRPGRAWRQEVEGFGDIREGQFLRRTPRGVFDLWRLHGAIRAFQPDAIMAWRAPAARLIPRDVAAAKVVRLGNIRATSATSRVSTRSCAITRALPATLRGWDGRGTPRLSRTSLALWQVLRYRVRSSTRRRVRSSCAGPVGSRSVH